MKEHVRLIVAGAVAVGGFALAGAVAIFAPGDAALISIPLAIYVMLTAMAVTD